MKNLFLLCAAIALFPSPAFAGDEDIAIVAATKSYMTATFGLTKVAVTVEQIAEGYARVKVVPDDPKITDQAWVFLKKEDGKWTALTLGGSFTTEDYQQLGIPNALRIP